MSRLTAANRPHFTMFIFCSYVSCILNENILLMPMELIFKEALEAANVILCAILTETHYPAMPVMTLISANKEKLEMSVFVSLSP